MASYDDRENETKEIVIICIGHDQSYKFRNKMYLVSLEKKQYLSVPVVMKVVW